MDNRKTKRSGAERQAAYRARLAASGEPPVDVVAAAFLTVTVSASLKGENLSPATIIERAAAIVIADPRFSQEGFDNVLGRVAQPVSRHRRLA